MKKTIFILLLISVVIPLAFLSSCADESDEVVYSGVPLVDIKVDLSEYEEKGIVPHTITNNSGTALVPYEPAWYVWRDNSWVQCMEKHYESKIYDSIAAGETVNGLDSAPDEGFSAGRYMLVYSFEIPGLYHHTKGNTDAYLATAVFEVPEREE